MSRFLILLASCSLLAATGDRRKTSEPSPHDFVIGRSARRQQSVFNSGERVAQRARALQTLSYVQWCRRHDATASLGISVWTLLAVTFTILHTPKRPSRHIMDYEAARQVGRSAWASSPVISQNPISR